jgi:hypothetical protein
MKPEDKAVVQQALEFLEMISPQFPPLVYTETDRKRDEASTALRQLLEQPESAPVQEPDYAWTTVEDYEKEAGFQVGVGFKMAWVMARTTNGFLNKLAGDSTPIVATPLAQPEDKAKRT